MNAPIENRDQSLENPTDEGSSSNVFINEMVRRPRSVSETGLSSNLLAGLLVKHLYDGGPMTINHLSVRTALAGPILEELLNTLRTDAYVEIRASTSGSPALRYCLTDRGRLYAYDELAKGGYRGPAPISVEQYSRIVRAQSIHKHRITRTEMHRSFADIVIRADLLDQLGPALHSGRAVFLHGPAGTGKTYVGQRLTRMFEHDILVPHAIAVGDTVIQMFDPLIHQRVDDNQQQQDPVLASGLDPRFILCRRPVVITGGELTLDMLEVQYDANTKQNQAPLQLKANNGVYMIDDLGRQRVDLVDLFNRWIVPLETSEDYLAVSSGLRFNIPFDVVLIFSTNLDPSELNDQAFLRRVGHKIGFGPLHSAEFAAIWRNVCEDLGVTFDSEVFNYVVHELYANTATPMLACHPKDLLHMAMDDAWYQGCPNKLTREMLNHAWNKYFVTPAYSTTEEPGIASQQIISQGGHHD